MHHPTYRGNSLYVLARPGYPYTDRQDILLYNLDIVFQSETHYISFANSEARSDLIAFIKENMTGVRLASACSWWQLAS